MTNKATDEEMAYMALKGAVSMLTVEEQNKVEYIARDLRNMIKENEKEGMLALALVGAEIALQA